MSTSERLVICGIDVGSTNTKVIALDGSGQVRARAHRPTPRQADLTIDPRALLDAVEDMIVQVCGRELTAAALCAAGVGEDGVLVDAALEPITAALAWFDPRREVIFADLAPELSVAAGLGCADDPARTLVGWRWARDQAGAGAARSWVALTDYLALAWTGTPFMSDTLAARTAAWDVTAGAWLPDRVELALGSTDLLPPVVPAGQLVGTCRSERLLAAGVVTPQTVVVAGGHDHPIGGWGVTQAYADAVLDSMGTAEVVVAQSPATIAVRADDVDTAAGIRQRGTTLLRVEELARNIEWAARDGDLAGTLRMMLAGTARPDSYVHSDAYRPGDQGGQEPRFASDAPTSTISRASAVLGALARRGADAAAAVSLDLPANAPLLAAGGWSRSAGWMQIKAQFSQRPLRLVGEPEVTAVGVALLAAATLGWEIPAGRALGQPDAGSADVG